MAETTTRVPVKTEQKAAAERAPVPAAWHPFGSLRREVDRLFEDFDRGFWRFPFRRPLFEVGPLWQAQPEWGTVPAVDIVEKDKSYEVTADLPGMDEKNLEVKLVNGSLLIKGEKHEEKEEKNKDYWLQERHFGSFERRVAMPEGVDTDKIEAAVKKGVLTVTLPKKAVAQKPEKKIEVKAA